jgi:hypothetical protein
MVAAEVVPVEGMEREADGGMVVRMGCGEG